MIGTIAAPVLDVVVDGGGVLLALLPLELVDELGIDDPPGPELLALIELGLLVDIELEFLILAEADKLEEVITDLPELEGLILVDANESEVVFMDPSELKGLVLLEVDKPEPVITDPLKLEGLIPVNEGTEPEEVPVAATIILSTWRG